MYNGVSEILRKANLPKLKVKYIDLLKSVKREGMDKLIAYIESTDFFEAPASTRFHSSHEGGLLEHSLNVYDRLDYRIKNDPLYNNLGIKDDSVIISALLHDLCKVNCYKIEIKNIKNENGEWIPTPIYIMEDNLPLGHGEKSVIMAQQFIKLTKEEVMAIRYHMGAFIEGEANNASKVFNDCPLALALHIADEEATDIIENVNKA